MARTIYKADSEYRDPTTGTIYLNGAGNKGSSQTSPASNTNTVVSSNSAATATSPTSNVIISPALNNQSNAQGSSSYSSTKKVTSGTSGYSYDPFQTSDYTKRYASKLKNLENNKPDEYSSKYDDTIASLVDKITNRKSFSVTDDANYNQLYNNYKERYTANAQRAMNDALASANASTGGYGSSYGQIAAQQAYDQQMEGLNDVDLSLIQLAYQMYGDDVADNYNQLSAITGLDNTDYSRYRDDVSDYYNDLQYYANQADASYDRDYTAWSNDREFDYDVWNNDRNYDYTAEQQAYQNEYQKYQDAVTQAQSLAASGLSVPDYLTAIIDEYTSKYGYGSGSSSNALQALAAQAVAAAAAKSSRSSSGGSSGKKSSGKSSGSSGYSLDSGDSTKKASATGVIQPFINAGLISDGTGINALKGAQALGFVPSTTGTSTNSSADANITNRNGAGWIYIDGLGRLTYDEVDKGVNTDKTIKEITNMDGTITYKKISK